MKTLLIFLRWIQATAYKTRMIKSAVVISIWIVALHSKQAPAQLLLHNFNAKSEHRHSDVWSGVFKSLDGNVHDASRYFKSKTIEGYVEGTFEYTITNHLSIVLPFEVDLGYDSDLYKAKPSLALGLGFAVADDTWAITTSVDRAFAFGGDIVETPCVDSFERDFHCGTGIPWSDYEVLKPKTHYSPDNFFKATFVRRF